MALTPEQEATHRTGIGGSQAAAAIGLSKWQTPLELYLEKTEGRVKEDGPTPDYLHFGNVLEQVIAVEYARRQGVKVARRTKAVRNKEHDYMFAHIDRQVYNERRILECKTSGQFMASDWGDSWTDQFPDAYRIQCHHQMICMPADYSCHLAVLIGGNDFRMYNVEYDPDLAKQIIEHEGIFWQRVIQRDPPPATTLADMALLWPADSGHHKLATEEMVLKAAELSGLKDMVKEEGKQMDALKLEIQLYMEDSAVLADEEGRALISWKKAKDSGKFDSKGFKEDNPDLYEHYTVDTPGSRRFLVK